MRLSRKTDYALRALMTLAAQEGKGTISIRELAQRNDVPKRFLEHIMLEMKQQGWVVSLPGRDGGYKLAKSAEQITMGMVVRHFDGLLAPIGCVSVNQYEPCTQEPFCKFRRVLLDIRNYTARTMDRATLAQVIRGTPVSRSEVFDDSLVGGAGI